MRTKNIDDSWHMEIDLAKCVGCNLCKKVCPNHNLLPLHEPNRCYAAWSKQSAIRKNGASGGIVSSLYQYCAENGIYFAGVLLDREFCARYMVSNQVEDIARFQRSKYTYSNMGDVYVKIRERLKKGERVIFVGLPCQVQALQTYLEVQKCEREQLWLIDLVCHGTPSPVFLQQHIKALNKRYGQETVRCEFRDPSFGTKNYAFTLYGDQTKKNGPFYIRKVNEDDYYQIGYHRGLIYRENCYRCSYAQHNRPGDLTLGDYHGLNRKYEWKMTQENVSCLLVNTDKGEQLLEWLDTMGIERFERPLDEPFTYEKQLNHPTVPPKERTIFLRMYQETKNFELAAQKAFSGYVLANKIDKFFHIKGIIRRIRKVIGRK